MGCVGQNENFFATNFTNFTNFSCNSCNSWLFTKESLYD